MRAWHRYTRKLPVLPFFLLNGALACGHILVLLGAGAFLPMLPNVAGSLGRAVPYAAWGQCNYVACMGLAILIARPLMRSLGARSLAIAAYLTFAASGLGVIASLSFYPGYVVCRLLQGLAAGLSMAPSLTLLLQQYRQGTHRIATAFWGLIAFVPFSIGPALGGYFAYQLDDWRCLFILFSALSVLIAAIIWALAPQQKKEMEVSPASSRQLSAWVHLAAIILALQTGLNLGILTDLSGHEIASFYLFSGTVILICLFWIRYDRDRGGEHCIDVSLFQRRNFSFGLLLLCLAFMGIQGSVVQYILRLQAIDAYTPWHAGLLFLPLLLGSKPLSLHAHFMIQHGYDPRLLASLALLIFALCFFWMGDYIRPATWDTLFWPQLLEGVALGYFLTPMNAIILSNVPAAQQVHAIDVINAARNVATAWSIALSDILWDRAADLAHNRLTTSSPAGNMAFLQGLSSTVPQPGTPIFHRLQERFLQESGWLTFHIMFQQLAEGFVLLAVMVWLASTFHFSRHVDDLERLIETMGEDV